MLNTLFELFKKEAAVSNIKCILESIAEIMANFDEEYFKDKNAKNAAIDCVIQILQKYKEPQ